MSSSSRLLRRALPIALVAVLAFVLAGCDWAQHPAATIKVDGKTYHISESELLDQVAAKKKDQPVSVSAVARTLSLRIQYLFWEQEANKRGLKIDPSQVAALKKTATSADGNSAFIDWAAKAQVAQNLVLDDLAKKSTTNLDQGLHDLYNVTFKGKNATCIEYVVGSDQAATTAAANAVKGGTSFASALATLQKTDTQAQGTQEVQCLTDDSLSSSPAQLVSALHTSPVGQVTGPLTVSAAQYIVFRVSSRGPLTFEQAKPQLQELYAQSQSQQQQTEASALQQAWLKKAKVEVNPRFGTWNAAKFQVDPPGGVPAKLAKGLDLGTTTTTTPSSALSSQ
ncbi:MAG TPA: peptidyl-prolyl cis-trans isomerase [Acidimicrobiales bacterium]|nr:peptidyl-prolyl cis-trans isomerase [Acidimicrobiales bacterium]